ncbi:MULTISPECIES: hypothetical protein [Acidiphilium]|uniref:hypothetical protein n=1 Tax=Acidiphilium TaxID=522 RepID=UPI00258B1063|nr:MULTISPECIES: hypothetical protein [Acidiphilium]HQT86347.1 hypothetical protein [Acidiphilium rubrum]
MNTTQDDSGEITEIQMRTIRFFRSLRPEAQPLFVTYLEAVIAGEGVRKAMTEMLTANGDPDAEAKAEAALSRMEGVRS